MALTTEDCAWAAKVIRSACNLREQDRDDAIQEGLVALWGLKERTRLEGAALYRRSRRAVMGAVVDLIRREMGRPGWAKSNGRARSVSLDAEPTCTPVARDAREPLDILIDREEAEAREAALRAAGDERFRGALVMARCGMPQRHAAEFSGRSESWLSGKLRRLREDLQDRGAAAQPHLPPRLRTALAARQRGLSRRRASELVGEVPGWLTCEIGRLSDAQGNRSRR